MNHSVYSFYFKHGPGRLLQVLEILRDGKPAPQDRIARILKVKKSRVSEILKEWGIQWLPEFPEEIQKDFQALLKFNEASVRESMDRLAAMSRHAPIFEMKAIDRDSHRRA